MYGARNRGKLKVDWVIVSLYFFLCLWGWLSIYAAVYDEDSHNIFNLSKEYGKQSLWIAGGIGIILLVFVTNYRVWTNFAPIWYALSIVLLLAVLIVGKEIGGARSWFGLGGFSLQPSEVGKFATALMLAFYAGLPRKSFEKWPHRIVGLAIVLTPGLLIAIQPDLGSTLVYLSLVLVLYREGMPGYYIGGVLIMVVLSITGLILELQTALIILGSICLLYTSPSPRD